MPRNLRAGLILLGAALGAGTIGFMIIESLSFLDALYLTVLTITTLGFAPGAAPLSTAGQLWTMAVLIAGMGAALYTAIQGLEYFADAVIGGKRWQRRMKKRIEDVTDHVVLCGYGRVGRTAWLALTRQGATVVVIDSDPERVDAAIESGALALEGDATSDDKLKAAGVERASVVIPAVATESDNLVITLSARALRPDVLIVARAFSEEAEKKLYLAGADRVVAPQLVGGVRLATLALRPNLAEFVDLVVSGRTVEFQVEEFSVVDGAPIAGKSLRELDLRRTSGALVLAVGDLSGQLSLNPDPGHVFTAGEIIIGVGTEQQLEALRGLVE